MKVLKISKDTYDVTKTDNENLSFSSELASHSIYNVVSATKGAASSSVTISHNLGFVPKVWVFLEDSDGDGDFLKRVPIIYTVSSGSVDYYVNTSDIVIESDVVSTAYTFQVIIFTREP